MPEPEHRKRYVAQKALLVNPQGKVLVVKSSRPNGAGDWWDFPGGQMEPGETPLETLEREVCEEIGVSIDSSKSRLFYSLTTKGFGSMADEDVLKLFYIVPDRIEDIALSHEHVDWMLVDPRQPLAEEITGFSREVLEAYIDHERIHGADRRILGHKGYGLIQLIYGNGKGKTTAALGQSIRAAGAGKRVAMIYFDKGGENHYSERAMLDRIDNIDYWATGRDRIDPVTGRFDFSIQEIDKEEAKRGLELVKTALNSGDYDLVVLDEINSTSDLGMLDHQSVLQVLDNRPADVEIIMTGRNPHHSFFDRAHLVTEMKLEKHYFYSGVEAREGLDF